MNITIHILLKLLFVETNGISYILNVKNHNDRLNDNNELYLFDHKTYIKIFHIFHISITILVEETSTKVNTAIMEATSIFI